MEKPESFISNTINAGVYLFASSIFTCIGEAFQVRGGSGWEVPPLTAHTTLSVGGLSVALSTGDSVAAC